VSCAPGPIFGPGGADAVRFTLVRPAAELAAAAGRITTALRRVAAG
jgi:aspartate/methionine/tyrosine aminotransferase